jgi:hypothetical protein
MAPLSELYWPKVAVPLRHGPVCSRQPRMWQVYKFNNADSILLSLCACRFIPSDNWVRDSRGFLQPTAERKGHVPLDIPYPFRANVSSSALSVLSLRLKKSFPQYWSSTWVLSQQGGCMALGLLLDRYLGKISSNYKITTLIG